MFEDVKGSLGSYENICNLCNGPATLYDGSKTKGRPKKFHKPGFPCTTCRSLVHLTCMSKSWKDSVYGFKPYEKQFICEKCLCDTVQIEITAPSDLSFLSFGE